MLNQRLTFSPSVRSHIVHVKIIDDDLFEANIENFTCTLSTNIPRLQLGAQSAIVNITDNDSKQSCNVCTILLTIHLIHSCQNWISKYNVFYE